MSTSKVSNPWHELKKWQQNLNKSRTFLDEMRDLLRNYVKVSEENALVQNYMQKDPELELKDLGALENLFFALHMIPGDLRSINRSSVLQFNLVHQQVGEILSNYSKTRTDRTLRNPRTNRKISNEHYISPVRQRAESCGEKGHVMMKVLRLAFLSV
jgi:hypothetical protein